MRFTDRSYTVLLFFFSCWISASAQVGELSNLRILRIPYQDSVQLPEGLLIAPSSFSIRRWPSKIPLATSEFQLYTSGVQILSPGEDSLDIQYRVLAMFPSGQSIGLDSSLLPTQNKDGSPVYRIRSTPKPSTVFDFGQLDYQGSFSRGLSFGNRQDLVLNSNFNVQLSGDLGDGIKINAAISDENIPLQPEGNTQQLQDFDRVYVEIIKNQSQLKAGDYELVSPDGYFSRYYKKLQGLSFQNKVDLGEGQLDSRASFALARGKFNRLNLVVQEGNQGPYQLSGQEGQRFVIVLSGTERVWLDGQLLERGIDRDYVLDYNLGEIQFTNRQLIRRESRVIVEYEFVDQRFARSMVVAGSSWETPKSIFSVDLFSQQDARASSGLFPLTDTDKQILAQAGDDPSKAFSPSIRLLETFSPAQVAYRLIDTTTSCGTEQILTLSSNPDEERYMASFGFVGKGKGLYRLSAQQNANEPVYEFAGRDPLNCEPSGDYQAATPLPRPSTQQLLTARYAWTPNAKQSFSTEVAWSQFNQNRFSDLDQSDNQGLAIFSDFQKAIPLQLTQPDSWNIHTAVNYEYKSQHFQALNPYRDPEFLRDWNLADFSGQGSVENALEHLFSAQLGLQHPEKGNLQYQIKGFNRKDIYQGLRHALLVDFKSKGWAIYSNSSLLQADSETGERRFLRPDFRLSKTLKQGAGWKWELGFQGEQNQRFLANSDSLDASGFAFYSYQLSTHSPEKANIPLGIRYQDRSDYLPESLGFQRLLRSREIALEATWQNSRVIKLNGNLVYRNLKVDNAELYTGNAGNNFLGRLTATFLLGKGLIRSSVNYDVGGGQEPKRNFSFIKVRKGEGNYIWLDSLYNQDRIIQPNEMEIAPFADQADYVRVSTFSSEFLQTNDVNLNWSLQLTPRAIWFNARQKWKLFLNRFSNQTSLRIQRRTEALDADLSWNPFEINLLDSNLIAANVGVRNILFFNRGNPVYEIQMGWTDNQRKNILSTGFESRINASNFLKLRLKLGSTWLSTWTITKSKQAYDSEFFDNKNYSIEGWNFEPSITWVKNSQIQWKLAYKLEQKNNQIPGAAKGFQSHDFSSTFNWNPDEKTRLELRNSMVWVDFDGQANSPVGFALLNGLQAGNNLLWNLGIDRQIGKNLSLQIQYEGRKTGMARVVHVGRAQVSALF